MSPHYITGKELAMELDLIEEEVPKIVRLGGSGREPEKWEEHLTPLTESPGKSFRVWTYDKKTSAVSRMSVVRNRLTLATPEAHWEIKVRQVPDSDQFGVYITYLGTFTDEQVQTNAAARAERSARTRSSRPSGDVATPPVGDATPANNGADAATQPAQTAKEKVAAARAAKK